MRRNAVERVGVRVFITCCASVRVLLTCCSSVRVLLACCASVCIAVDLLQAYAPLIIATLFYDT